MTAKAQHTIDEVRKWVGTIAAGMCVYFLADMHHDFKEQGREVDRHESRLNVVDVRLDGHFSLINDNTRRLNKIQHTN